MSDGVEGGAVWSWRRFFGAAREGWSSRSPALHFEGPCLTEF